MFVHSAGTTAKSKETVSDICVNKYIYYGTQKKKNQGKEHHNNTKRMCWVLPRFAVVFVLVFSVFSVLIGKLLTTRGLSQTRTQYCVLLRVLPY